MIGTTLVVLYSFFFLIDVDKVHSSNMTSSKITNTPSESYNIDTQWGTKGNEEGQFSGLNDVMVTTDNSIFVPDYENHMIQEFTPDGQFVSAWGIKGTNNGQLNKPHSMITMGISM